MTYCCHCRTLYSYHKHILVKEVHMRRYAVTIYCIGFILCLLIVVPELQAPEITEREIIGYDAYHVADNGAILDKDGIIKGWMHGNTVYDTQWNSKYYIHGGRLCRTGEDVKM